MKVLLTGADGFLGRTFIRKYSETFEILALDRWWKHSATPGVKRVTRLLDTYKEPYLPYEVDAVIHLAADPIVGSDDSVIANNVNALLSVLMTYAGKCPVYAVTTDKVLEEGLALEWFTPIYARTNTTKAEPYRTSKICCEAILDYYSKAFPDIHTIRFGNLFGPGDYHMSRLVPYVCRQILNGEPIVLRSDGHSRRSWTHVEKAAVFLARLATCGIPAGIWQYKCFNADVRSMVWELCRIGGCSTFDKVEYDIADDHEIKRQTMVSSEMPFLMYPAKMTWLESTFYWYKENYASASIR